MSLSTEFSSMGLSQPLINALHDLKFDIPTPIQAQAIPVLLEGKDVLGQAQTGTGKTAAFALPLIDKIEVDSPETQLLVLAPTRELAQQISLAITQFTKYIPDLSNVTVCGGDDYRQQIRSIKRGAQIIVSTPGRLIDLVNKDIINLSTTTAVVLDEADEMLKMGFIDDVEWILEKTGQNAQLALFSATMPPAILRITQKYLKTPEHINIKRTQENLTTITQKFMIVTPHNKLEGLKRLLEVEKQDGIIIFVKTKADTETLADELKKSGHSTIALNGDMAQDLRKKSIEKLKNGQVDILIATDVAARGIDIDRISLVINYDVPYNVEAYTHRIGRTGRAGRQGTAILFVTPREQSFLQRLERMTKQKVIKIQPPSLEEIREKRLDNFHGALLKIINDGKHQETLKIIEALSAKQNLSALDIAASLTYMHHRALLESGSRHKDSFAESQFSERKSFKAKGMDREKERDRGRNRDRDRDQKFSAPRSRHNDDNGPMEKFKIDVGSLHGVKARNIVGAIANEAGIEGHFIRNIEISDKHSTFSLPKGMPKKVYHSVKNAWICGKQINLTRI